MARRKKLAGFLAVLLFAAHVHCVAEHAQEVAKVTMHGQQTNVPLGDKSPCEHKTGCICQGATLGSIVAVPAAELDIFTFLEAPSQVAISLFREISPAAAGSSRGDDGYVVSARQLRALIESYLL